MDGFYGTKYNVYKRNMVDVSSDELLRVKPALGYLLFYPIFATMLGSIALIFGLGLYTAERSGAFVISFSNAISLYPVSVTLIVALLAVLYVRWTFTKPKYWVVFSNLEIRFYRAWDSTPHVSYPVSELREVRAKKIIRLGTLQEIRLTLDFGSRSQELRFMRRRILPLDKYEEVAKVITEIYRKEIIET